MEDEIRIWDYLYNIGAPRTVEDIAQSLELKPDDVAATVVHDWFGYDAGVVSIAKYE